MASCFQPGAENIEALLHDLCLGADLRWLCSSVAHKPFNLIIVDNLPGMASPAVEPAIMDASDDVKSGSSRDHDRKDRDRDRDRSRRGRDDEDRGRDRDRRDKEKVRALRVRARACVRACLDSLQQ